MLSTTLSTYGQCASQIILRPNITHHANLSSSSLRLYHFTSNQGNELRDSNSIYLLPSCIQQMVLSGFRSMLSLSLLLQMPTVIHGGLYSPARAIWLKFCIAIRILECPLFILCGNRALRTSEIYRYRPRYIP